MPQPPLSDHIRSREPSDIRIAGIRFAARPDQVAAINVAIGNVSLPMHPAMTRRMGELNAAGSPFHGGVLKYTSTVGMDETRQAFLHVIASSGFDTKALHCQITDGGSQGMELILLATCGLVDGHERPVLLIDPAYTNYNAFASRLGIPTVSFSRALGEDGRFSLPPMAEIEEVIRRHRPGALVVIPYDNPNGQFYDQATLNGLARLCVAHDMWLVSDEAYRELFYTGGVTSSVWGVSEKDVPGISGRRVSLETTSKVWNSCGLRIGALVTDSQELHTRAVAENTANLCSSAMGQYIFGAIAGLSHAELRQWYQQQRMHYQPMMAGFARDVHALLPEAIVSSPDAALYSVVDVRRMVGPDFQMLEFVLWCAEEGAVELPEGRLTLLVAPMAGFYQTKGANPGRTQMRIAYVESPERMAIIPRLLAGLLTQYLARTKAPAAC
ncbi:MAG TPA: aminotransferase class I/II-fold pyridoxal phosphate-dependent enzyme [Candidatus Xenobia bacterium]|jgi:aspartate aminotransferase